MDEPGRSRPEARSWWWATVAVAACGPWPGWNPAGAQLLLVVAGCLVLARPRGKGRVPWLAVAVALAVFFLLPVRTVQVQEYAGDLERHCSRMLGLAEELAGDPDLQRLFAASGEALEPEMPFQALRWRLGGRSQRTIYLADDRGGLVAWAGAERAYPAGVRPLGQRRWGIVWSAGAAVLWVREPMLREGRLVGAVTVADRSALDTRQAWGMQAPRGHRLRLGFETPGTTVLAPKELPALRVPVACLPSPMVADQAWAWAPWALLAVLALAWQPLVGTVAVALGGAALLLAPGATPQPALIVAVLAAAAAVARNLHRLAPRWRSAVVAVAMAAAGGVALLGVSPQMASWLPSHLLRPGWGGVWMVALGWIVVGWPGARSGARLSLGRRFALGVALAMAGLVLQLGRVPVELLRAGEQEPQLALPRGELDLAGVLPTAPGTVVDDLATSLAERWRLHRWRTPSAVLVVDREGLEVSRWGDLDRAGDSVRIMRSWYFEEPVGLHVELWVASEPWSHLFDWRPGEPAEASWKGPVWFAVLSRSGIVEATLHPQIRNLDAVRAGDLFHAGGGWLMMRVGDRSQLARVWRRGEWLVAGVARYPAPSVWAVHAALGCLWALLGMAVAQPPRFRRQQLASFGGRLRVLVAGGVILPLVILTLFLHLRLQQEEDRLEQVMGFDALRSARYTATHLAGGFEINDELARWLSRELGGEVALFDGWRLAAISRPDLMVCGVLPELPAAAVYPGFLIGRDNPVVLRQQGRLAAVGAVELRGKRLLLEVFPSDPLQSGEAPEAVDWLLTGAVLAALLALMLTSRVEQRLSASLRDLVAVARRLHRGEPVGEVRRPQETDLAEVLDAVRLMSAEVQQREQSLRHQEELLRVTLSTLAPAVMVLDERRTVRFANPSAERLLEVHGEQVLERVIPAGDLFGTVGSPRVETVQPLPGEELTWRVGVAGVPLPDGSPGVVAAVDDVTDMVRVDRLNQLNQMARIVAHEVKNPLTPIRLWVQELDEARRRQDPGLDQLFAEACGEILVQVERLQATANSFSNLVALERWRPEPVDLGELVEEVLRAFLVLERRGIALVRELGQPGSARVVGDRQWLHRALGNLVKNSVEALGEGEGEIRVRLAVRDDTVVLEVEDTAGGVPAEQVQDLFSPSFSTTSSGSGLGLALVHQVVVRCQGKATAVNGDEGLVIRLEMPLASATMSS